MQLMDDDIVSVVALAFIADRSRKDKLFCDSLDQLTLSVYLMVKCHLQLHHSVTSLAQSLAYIQLARRRRHDRLGPVANITFDPLVLKLAEHIVQKCISD